MSFLSQQELTGAAFALSRAAEAVEAAPWLSQTQMPGEMCRSTGSQRSSRTGKSPGTLLDWTSHTTEPLEDDKWID